MTTLSLTLLDLAIVFFTPRIDTMFPDLSSYFGEYSVNWWKTDSQIYHNKPYIFNPLELSFNTLHLTQLWHTAGERSFSLIKQLQTCILCMRQIPSPILQVIIEQILINLIWLAATGYKPFAPCNRHI